jgi:exodeoxyribonuclease VII large subunit
VVPRLEDLQGRLEELIARMIRRTGRAITVRRRELLLLRQRLSGDRLTAERRASVDRLRARVHQLGQRRLASERRQCSALALRLGRADPRRRLASGRQRLERLQARLKAVALRVDALRRQRLLRALERLRFAGAIAHQLAPRAARLDRLVVALRALDPNAALRRGYAIVRDLDSGAAIRDARAVAPRQRLEVTLASGSLGVDVVTVHAPATDASSGGPR